MIIKLKDEQRGESTDGRYRFSVQICVIQIIINKKLKVCVEPVQIGICRCRALDLLKALKAMWVDMVGWFDRSWFDGRLRGSVVK